jgi:hypothetical protein
MKTIQILFTVLILSIICFAQPEKGKIGLSAEIQSQQMDFLVPIFATNNLALSPAVGVAIISDQYSDLSLGVILRYYFSNDVISPFIGGRLGTLLYIPNESDMIADIIYGPLFGGEYYFSKNFSVGIELQLNAVSSAKNSMRFGNPGRTNINTATAFFATIFF